VRVAEHGAPHCLAGRLERGRGGKRESRDRRRERARAFEVGQVRGGQVDHRGPGDVAREDLAMARPRQRHIADAVDHEGGAADAAETLAFVHVADGGAAAGVPLRIGAHQDAPRLGDCR
jgi:hypothetical protein